MLKGRTRLCVFYGPRKFFLSLCSNTQIFLYTFIYK